MRRIVHLSDLHFGRANRAVVDPLVEATRDLRPHIVVVSGDLTQDAREDEFTAARAFLDALPEPRIVVPGNHDLPFFNILRRVARGLDGYRRRITPDLTPFYSDDEIAIAGVNTARVWPVRGGRINEQQVERVQERMRGLEAGVMRVLVTHHPFDLAGTFSPRHLVGRARMALRRLVDCVDLLLAGHMHVGHAGHTAIRYKLNGDSAVFVQAGTATSNWIRGEENSFNLVVVERPRIEVRRFTWAATAGRFQCANTESFVLDEAGWSRQGPPAACDEAA